jgi:hypothetical protein
LIRGSRLLGKEKILDQNSSPFTLHHINLDKNSIFAFALTFVYFSNEKNEVLIWVASICQFFCSHLSYFTMFIALRKWNYLPNSFICLNTLIFHKFEIRMKYFINIYEIWVFDFYLFYKKNVNFFLYETNLKNLNVIFF